MNTSTAPCRSTATPVNHIERNTDIAPLFVTAFCGCVSRVAIHLDTVEQAILVHGLSWALRNGGLSAVGTLSGFQFILGSKYTIQIFDIL